MVSAAAVNAGTPGGPHAAGRAKYHVMVVDDSAVIRGFIIRALESDRDIEVVASVSNGELAVKAIARADVDVVILDIDMPVMDGLTALPKLLAAKPGVKVIMASTLTRKHAAISLRALTAGASDYIPKPTSARDLYSSDDFRRELISKIKALVPRAADAPAQSGAVSPRDAGSGLFRGAPVVLRAPSAHRPAVLGIGSSTGGPQALFTVLRSLRSQFKVPILITQHMPPTFTTILAEHIQRVSGAPCAEGRDKEPVKPGRIYIAPGQFHMIVEPAGKSQRLRITTDPPENFCRPAVDPMFRSLAEVYGPKVLGVILTGMGRDGLNGGQAVVKAGGTLIAQDERSSVVWGMPGAVATAGLCSATLAISDVAPRLLTLINGGRT